MLLKTFKNGNCISIETIINFVILNNVLLFKTVDNKSMKININNNYDNKKNSLIEIYTDTNQLLKEIKF